MSRRCDRTDAWLFYQPEAQARALYLVPTLRLGTQSATLCVTGTSVRRLNLSVRDAERPDVRSHAERGAEAATVRRNLICGAGDKDTRILYARELARQTAWGSV